MPPFSAIQPLGAPAPLLPDPDSSATIADEGSLRIEANPDRDLTRIAFSLPRAAHVSLMLYDVQGRPLGELWTGVSSRGKHTLAWPGIEAQMRRLPAGIYFLVLTTPEGKECRKLLRRE